MPENTITCSYLVSIIVTVAVTPSFPYIPSSSTPTGLGSHSIVGGWSSRLCPRPNYCTHSRVYQSNVTRKLHPGAGPLAAHAESHLAVKQTTNSSSRFSSPTPVSPNARTPCIRNRSAIVQRSTRTDEMHGGSAEACARPSQQARRGLEKSFASGRPSNIARSVSFFLMTYCQLQLSFFS